MRLSLNTKEEDVENTDEIVVNVAKKLGVDIECSDISRSHRVGRPGSKPRPILVKFVSEQKKGRFLPCLDQGWKGACTPARWACYCHT